MTVRGRRVRDLDPSNPADFTLLLADGPVPMWPHRRIRWPDFGIPLDRRDAVDALTEAYQRAKGGERVEACCAGGRGRTGTALAALAVLDGLAPRDAVRWVRQGYHPRAVETWLQGLWLHAIGPAR